MDVALRSLLSREVCIISGGQMGQFRTQVLDNLNASDELASAPDADLRHSLLPLRAGGGSSVTRTTWTRGNHVIESLELARELGLWENP